MRRVLSIMGAILVVLGAAMYELLIQLRSETFRADLPPWMNLSLVVAGLGLVISGLGIALPERQLGRVQVGVASKYLAYATLINALIGAGFSLPLLVPTFEFPILITRWPGIYMVIGYAFFVMIGVLGTFGWSAFYHSLPEVLLKREIYRPLFVFQLFALEVGVYLMSSFMFLAGYIGSSLVNQGVGDAVVGASMEFAVIPSALGIFLLAASTFVGATNVLISRRGS